MMLKRVLVMALLVGGLTWCGASQAEARGRFRGYAVRRPVVAPVRRGVARAVLPPYPVARGVVARPYVRSYTTYPVYAAPVYATPIYAAPVYRRPGVSVSVGF